MSARATIYPGHVPEPSPRLSLRSPRLGSLQPGVSRGTHKGLHAGAAWHQLCPLLQRCLDTSAQLLLRRGVPISSLGVDGKGPVLTPHIAAHLLRGSAACPWDLGSLPCSFPPSYPAGRGTGVTGTLRPGCFPINCYFLIPLAVRRAASWLRLLRPRPLDARQPAAEGRRDAARPAVPSRGPPAPRGAGAGRTQPGARRAEPNRAGAVTEGSGPAAPAAISASLAGERGGAAGPGIPL